MKKQLRILLLALMMLPCLVFAACGDNGAHVHSYGTVWKTNTTQHWHECDCGEANTRTNHTWDAGVILEGDEPTYTEEGTKTFTCTSCDAIKTEPVSHTHEYGATWQKNATQHWYDCPCGEKSSLENHTWNVGVILSGDEPTFTARGRKTFTCTDCDATKTELVSHTHEYGSVWLKSATQHWRVCPCGKEAVENHAWDAGVILEGDEATFETEGTMTYTCTVCDETKTETIENSLSTFQQLDEKGLYTMEYLEDYKFDEFLSAGGASSDEELAEFLQNVLLNGLPVEIQAPGVGCSTFSGELAESGDNIFARNFDFSYSPSLIVTTNPENGYKSISTVNLAFVGYTLAGLQDLDNKESLLKTLVAPYIPLDGVNEKGLSIGVLQIQWYPTKQTAAEKINITTTAMIRLILDRAATVDEAIALMGQYNMNDSLGANFHYQIADKSGKSVVVEYFDNEMKVIEQDPDESFHCATNFLLSPDVPAHVPKGGVARYDTLRDTLTGNNGIFADEQAAMDLLEDVKQGSTQWSVIYNLDKLTSMFIYAGQYTKPAHTFEL